MGLNTTAQRKTLKNDLTAEITMSYALRKTAKKTCFSHEKIVAKNSDKSFCFNMLGLFSS